MNIVLLQWRVEKEKQMGRKLEMVRKSSSKSKTVSPLCGMHYDETNFIKALNRIGGMGTAANVATAGCRTWTANEHLV